MMFSGVRGILNSFKFLLFENMDTKLYLLLSLSFILCIGVSYLFLMEIRRNNIFKNTAKEFYGKTEEIFDSRKKEEEEIRKKFGNVKRRNILYKWDLSIEHSGIKKVIPFLNTEIYILTVFVCSVVVAIVVINVFNNMLIAFLSALLVIFIYYILITLMCMKTDNEVDKYITDFEDALESYSRITDDLIYLFEQAAYEFNDENIIKTSVLNCVKECRIDGNIKEAIDRLILRINHRKFRELIQSLEQCSRNNANYAAVIRSCQDDLQDSLSEKAVRKEKANQAKFVVIVIVGVFLSTIKIIEKMINQDVLSFYMMTSAGKILLLICFIMLLVVIWKMITLGRK